MSRMLLILPLLAWLALSTMVRGDDWPHFLGPSMDTTWREEGVRTRFAEAGMPLAGEHPLGGGYSGPAVVGGKVYLARPNVYLFSN
mgnify:CR=1 FL=1